jgi:hypothetical protein
MNSFSKFLAVSVLLVTLVACNDDDVIVIDEIPTSTADLRIIHAVPDAPAKTFRVGA